MRIAPSLRRFGSDLVNCYLLEEGGRVTIVDAGLPAYFGDLTDELAAMGRTIEDVDALVEGTLPQHRVTKLSPRPVTGPDLKDMFLSNMRHWEDA